MPLKKTTHMENITNLVNNFAKNDDQKAFSEFFNYYYPLLLRFSLFILKSEILAEEVVSDVFVKIWNNRVRILEVDNLDLYLFTSVRNQSLTYLKRRDTNHSDINDFDDFSFINKVHPESELLDQELLEMVNKAINSLPPKCQLIFRLSRDEGFNYQEVAQILELSKSTVKNQMTIALKKIREELCDYFNDPTEKKYPFLLSVLLCL